MGMMTYTITATAAAAATTSTATSSKPIIGNLIAVYISYEAGIAATTDLIIKTVGDGVIPSITFLTITDSATSAWYYPRVLAHNTSGAALTGWYAEMPLADYVNIAAAQTTAAKSISVTLFYED